jgi:hypothetical protein
VAFIWKDGAGRPLPEVLAALCTIVEEIEDLGSFRLQA